jgi:hypothetical protein
VRQTFKQFLDEATVKDSVNRKKVIIDTIKTKQQAEDALALLMEKCPSAINAYLENRLVIYRGMSDGPEMLEVNYSKGTRRAENTDDYYRMIIDTNPEFAGTDLPKRNKSLVASTDYMYARGYGQMLYSVFPFENTIIGVVPANDIFHIKFDVFDRKGCFVDDISSMFGQIFKEYKTRYKSIKTGVITPAEFISNIDEIGLERIINLLNRGQTSFSFITDPDMDEKKFAKKYGITDGKSFLDYFYHNVFSQQNLKFKALLPAAFYAGNIKKNEVWIGDKCIIVYEDAMHKILDYTDNL